MWYKVNWRVASAGVQSYIQSPSLSSYGPNFRRLRSAPCSSFSFSARLLYTFVIHLDSSVAFCLPPWDPSSSSLLPNGFLKLAHVHSPLPRSYGILPLPWQIPWAPPVQSTLGPDTVSLNKKHKVKWTTSCFIGKKKGCMSQGTVHGMCRPPIITCLSPVDFFRKKSWISFFHLRFLERFHSWIFISKCAEQMCLHVII